MNTSTTQSSDLAGPLKKRLASMPAWLLFLPLVLLVIASYWPAVYPASMWDDQDYLLACEPVHRADGLYDIWFSPTTTPHYFPILFTSYWLEYRLWGLYLPAYHAVNLLLHAASVGLLWHILKKLSVPGAWFAAALWAVHPVQVETVAWISERKNILGGVFFLLAVLAYIQMPTAGSIRRRASCYAGVVLAMCAAILTKQVMVVLPAVLFLVDVWRDRAVALPRLKWTLPLLIPAAAMAAVGVYQEHHWVGALGPEFDFSWPQRFAIAGHSLIFYLQKFIFPWPLLTVYPRLDLSSAVPAGIVLFALAMLILAALWFWRRRLGWGPSLLATLFVVLLLPALGFISFYTQLYTFVADHYAYMALGALTIGVGALLMRIPSSTLRTLLAAVVLLASVGVSCGQSFLYRSELALWRHTLEHNPQSWIAMCNVAMLGMKETALKNPRATIDDYRGYLALYQKAMAIRPDWQTYFNIGLLYQEQGYMPEAIAAFERSEALKPESVRRAEMRTPEKSPHTYHFIIATAYEKRGQLDNAILWYRKAVAARRSDGVAWLKLGGCLMQKQAFPQALDAFTQGTQAAPDKAELWFFRGVLLRQMGQEEEGVKSLLKAHDLDPTVINRVMQPPPK